jgi:hypothetical protein
MYEKMLYEMDSIVVNDIRITSSADKNIYTRRSIMKNKFVLIGMAIAVLATSCISFQASGLQMGLDDNSDKVETLGDFTDHIWVNKFLGTSGGTTLFNLSSTATDYAIRTAIEKQIKRKNGTAAINVRIRYGSNPITYFLNWLTFTVWAPSSITITGTIIREI